MLSLETVVLSNGANELRTDAPLNYRPFTSLPYQVVENLGLVAARLSCRRQRDGHRWVVSRAKRVAAESGSLVYKVASRLDGILYFFKVIERKGFDPHS